MMNKERFVLQALQTAALNAVAASTDPTITVKMMGRVFEPAEGQKWIEVIQLPNNVANPTVGDEFVYRGFLQILLYWPVEDEGVYTPMDLVQSIASYFTKGRKLPDGAGNVEVTVVGNPDFNGVTEDSPNMIFPLSIRYQYYDKA